MKNIQQSFFNDEEEYYLDYEGYQRCIIELDMIDKKIKSGLANEIDQGYNNLSDDHYISFDILQHHIEMGKLFSYQKDIKDKLSHVVIISEHNNPELIDLNDTIEILIEYFDNKGRKIIENDTVTLVAHDVNIIDEIAEVSINSPLGKALYMKRVGEKASYKVNNNHFFVTVISKCKKYTK